jgi:tetratricopeptide (TPR) repeat protein
MIRRRLLSLLLLALAGASARTSSAADADPLAAGRAALERGDADQAAVQLEKAVGAKPASPEAHYWLGMAYGAQTQRAGLLSKMGLAKKAKAEFLRTVELDPNSIDARFRLLEFYVAAPGIAGGDEAKGMEQAAEIKRRDALDGHRAYARVYTMQKKLDLAEKEMGEAVRENPKSAKARYFHGNTLLNQKDWKRSLEEYDAALSLDAGYMPAHFRIGQLAAQSEPGGSGLARGEESIRKYLAYKPSADEPGLARAWYWLGMIQEKQGKKGDARQSYESSKKLDPDSKDVADALKRVS